MSMYVILIEQAPAANPTALTNPFVGLASSPHNCWEVVKRHSESERITVVEPDLKNYDLKSYQAGKLIKRNNATMRLASVDGAVYVCYRCGINQLFGNVRSAWDFKKSG